MLKLLAQSHGDSKWWRWNLNMYLHPNPCLLIYTGESIDSTVLEADRCKFRILALSLIAI
jgi:hypothetical protein